jgi:hypothetical protein
MTEIRPARAADALRLAGQLAQLGYPSELDAVTSRLAGILKSATQQILVAAPPDDSRINGYIGLERRLTLHQDEHVEITDLVVDAAARRPASAAPWYGRRTVGSTAPPAHHGGPVQRRAPRIPPVLRGNRIPADGDLAHLPQAGLGHACSILQVS